METLNLIQAGYTEKGFVKAEKGIHGELRFEFRPVLVTDRSAHVSAIDGMKADAFDRKTAEVIEQHLISWDVTNAKGQPVPPTRINILRLKPRLFAKLYSIILGFEPSDIDSQWDQDATDQLVETSYDAAIEKQTVGAVREEQDSKN